MSRAHKRRSSRRRQRSLRRNPLSTKQKALAVGGIIVVGGISAFALSASASAPPPPTGPQVDPRAVKEAECAALQASLVQLRALPTPDMATMARIEAQIATCLAQARELGSTVDPTTTAISAGDASYAQMDGWFNEYKATSEHDPLKRNNIRQSILGAGTALAATYSNAVTQSPNKAATRLVAQSILRALDASITRQLCFLNNERGCGTSGSNEDQPDAKAAQEQERVTAPLTAAYMAAVTKVGGPSRALADVEGQRFLNIILRPCTFQKTFNDGQFNHYRATEWSDALRRNNTRQSILAGARNLTTCLQQVFATASSFGSMTTMRAVGTLTIAALSAAITRWACFFTNGTGCGTFASNEDQPDAKAAQEHASTIVPLMAAYTGFAGTLARRGDLNAFEPLVRERLRICSTMKTWIDGQFNHYRATEWSDALRRNNTRQSILAGGRDLAACLRETLAVALAGGPAADAVPTMTLAPTLRLAPMATTVRLSGLGSVTTPAPSALVLRMVRSVGDVTLSALTSAVDRRICFLFGQGGCGTFGVNEDQPDVKAAQEQSNTIAPLTALYEQIVIIFKNSGDMTPAVRLSELKLRVCTAAKAFIDSQFNHYKATEYSDALRRNNTRQSILAVGASLSACLQEALNSALAFKSVAGVRLVAASLERAIDAAMSRRDCYLYDQPGCGRFAANEDHGNDKAAHERDRVINPLVASLRRAIAFLVTNGDAQAEMPLMRLLLRSINIAKTRIDAQYGNLHATDYSDPVKRNNIRGDMIVAGREMVAGFRAARPATAAGRALLRPAAQLALKLSQDREGCYRKGAGGCDRQWGTFTEPSGGEKADQELTEITNPLAALLADRTSAGLGSFMDDGFAGVSGYAWLGIGAVALVAVGVYQSQKKTHRNKRRRTSRARLVA